LSDRETGVVPGALYVLTAVIAIQIQSRCCVPFKTAERGAPSEQLQTAVRMRGRIGKRGGAVPAESVACKTMGRDFELLVEYRNPGICSHPSSSCFGSEC